MSGPELDTLTRRSWFVPLCAACAWLAGAWLGCLNPLPDDFPSERDTETRAPGPVMPSGESDTPSPGEAINGAGGSGASAPPSPSTNPDDDESSGGDTPAPDAGTDAGGTAADAGALQRAAE